jgi:hypothetical protein
MEKHLSTLDALLKDVTGNLSMGDSGKAAGYLKSLSVLAGAMSRSCQQEFELGLVDELEEMAPSDEGADGFQAKRQLNQRELDLSNMELALVNFFANVSSGCYMTAGAAAAALNEVANQIAKQEDTPLFPKPMTDDEMRAWAAGHGIEVTDETNLPEAHPAYQLPHSEPAAKKRRKDGAPARKRRGAAHV